MIYLDNSATTKPDPSVVESFTVATEQFFANPSSIHKLGGDVEKVLNKSREQIASILNVASKEIIFTSGGTEGNNLAIKGIALEHQDRGKHIITTEIEHPSVYDACKSLEKLGFKVTYLPVNKEGIISIKDLEQEINDDTILISIMHVNNELGSIQPIQEIGNIAKKYPKLYFHVDHVQGAGKVPLSLKNSGIDLCTFSGHKIHGLKGTGFMYVHQGVSLFPLLHGGNQEQKIRSGTENVAGAVSIAKALRLIMERKHKEHQHLYNLHHRLRSGLEKISGVEINTPINGAAPHILNFSVKDIKSEVMIHMLGEKDIFISTRSACSSKQADDSRILAACGLNHERSATALRISLSYDTSEKEIDTFLQVIEEAIKELTSFMDK